MLQKVQQSFAVQEWFFFSFTKREEEQNEFATMLHQGTNAHHKKIQPLAELFPKLLFQRCQCIIHGQIFYFFFRLRSIKWFFSVRRK